LKDNRDEGMIAGRNAVIEALRAGVAIDKVFIAKGGADSTLRYIASAAREAGAVVVEADRRKLDSMVESHGSENGGENGGERGGEHGGTYSGERSGERSGGNGAARSGGRSGEHALQAARKYAHQGVIAMAACAEYVTVADILEAARDKSEAPMIVLCDGISDPHNLGAIIRTCEAAGAHGVVIPKRRSAGLGATVAKTSSGAVYHLPVARVTNMTAAVAELKKSGVWVFGASAGGETPIWQADLKGPCAFVVGSEGAGISRLVNDACDFRVSIPMYGKIASLNASVSAAILVYEAVRQRRSGNSGR